MAQEFDDPFKELEQSVMEDMRRTYSEKTIGHFLNPRNLGEIPAPDEFGKKSIKDYLTFKNEPWKKAYRSHQDLK